MSTTLKRPEPVLDAATLAGKVSAVILAVGGLLRLIGLLPGTLDIDGLATQSSNVVLSIGVLWALVGPWLAARLRARDLVTPLAAPRDNAGNQLLSPDVALLVADHPGYASDIVRMTGPGGQPADRVRDYVESVRDAAEKRATAATDPDQTLVTADPS